MKHKKLIGILATSALLLGSVATFAACGGQEHKIERVDETQATCTEGGHAAYYKCTDEGCDKIFSDIEGKHEIKWDDVEKTDPLGHSMTHVEAKEADCTEDGANEHYHCNRCENDFADEAGATPMEDAVIPALGHDMKVVEKVIPVTGQPGVKAHYRCERENKEYFDSFGDKAVTDENRHELEYDMLTTAPSGWFDVHHDFSHSNDADPYVTIMGENGLNVATNEYYTDIAYTARVQKANVDRQFIALFFENQAIYSISVDNGKIKCDSEMSWWSYGTEQGYSYLNDDEWEHTLSAGERDCYEGNGLEVTLARTGKTVKVLVNGQVVHSATLADEYDETLAKGGMLVWNAVPSVKYYFRAEPQVQTPAVPKVTVSPVDAAHGSVTLNQQTFAYGDKLVVTVTPTDDYVFDTLFVNGREITKLTDGTYTTTATNIVNISVVFKAREYGSVNATVTGKKHGVTGNSIAENAAFELVGKNQTYSGSLSNGKLNVNKVLTGEYTLKIEGYLDQTITIEKDVEYTTAIVFEYDMFSMLHTNNGDEGYWNLTGTKNDFTHQNDTNVLNVLSGSDGMWVAYTNDKYDDLYFSATFKEGQSWDNRKAIQLVFDNGTGIQFGLKQDGAAISFGYWYSDRYLLNRGEEARLAPEEKIGNLSAEQLTKFNDNGITVSVVRTGNKIMLLVDGNTVRVLELFADYATKKCTPAIIIEWAGEQEIGVSVSTALPTFETPTFELTQGQNGTVTKTSGDTYSVWEKITLEITPDSNYRLKQLTVNGVVITGNKTEYSFYPVAGANTVAAEFEQIPYGNVSFSADDKWNADGLVITFQRNGETKTVTLGDNAVIENMMMDRWTATAVVGNVTVSLGEIYIDAEEITLDLAKMFDDAALANNRIVSANLATGEFVYNTQPDGATLWLNTVDIAQGSTFVATKISLPAESKEFLKNSGDKHETFSIFLKVGNVEKNVTLWWKQDENAFKFFSLDNWQGTDNLSAELKNAFIDGDGFYVVWAYNTESGKYEIYAGLTPQTVTKIAEWDTGLPKNGTLAAIGFGDGFKWGGESYQLNIQMNCGSTLNEALGIEE